MTTTTTRMAVLPHQAPTVVRIAISAAGGILTTPEHAEALVWLGTGPETLTQELARMPLARWVQLSQSGVESYLPLMRDGRTWTRAQGVLAEPVAEHALMLAMVALRNADRSVRAGHWLPQPPRTLFEANVVLVGGGAIGQALLGLLAPFRAHITVVRRRPEPLPGADQVVGMDQLDDMLADANLIILAPALTAVTHKLIAAHRLALMNPDACLVNVARGELVDTHALVFALTQRRIAAAALDVTDPEPLPDDHPLWQLENCFLTGHCAGDLPYAWPRFAALVADNVRRFRRREPLRGVVSLDHGY